MFSTNLKAIRKQKGLSQNELASMLNISKSSLAMYETDSRQPNLDLLVKICEKLNVSSDELLGIKLNDMSEIQKEVHDLIINMGIEKLEALKTLLDKS